MNTHFRNGKHTHTYIYIKYIYRPNKYIPCLKDEIPHVLWGSTKIRWLLNLAPVRCSLPASSTRSAWPGTIPLKLSRHRHLNSAKRNAYPHGQRIGLTENLNRRPWFLPSNIGFSCIFFHHPILWYRVFKAKVKVQSAAIGVSTVSTNQNLNKLYPKDTLNIHTLFPRRICIQIRVGICIYILYIYILYILYILYIYIFIYIYTCI